jgi:hypothetical protein
VSYQVLTCKNFQQHYTRFVGVSSMTFVTSKGDLGRLVARIEDEVGHKKGSMGIVQIWHSVSN